MATCSGETLSTSSITGRLSLVLTERTDAEETNTAAEFTPETTGLYVGRKSTRTATHVANKSAELPLRDAL